MKAPTIRSWISNYSFTRPYIKSNNQGGSFWQQHSYTNAFLTNKLLQSFQTITLMFESRSDDTFEENCKRFSLLRDKRFEKDKQNKRGIYQKSDLVYF